MQLALLSLALNHLLQLLFGFWCVMVAHVTSMVKNHWKNRSNPSWIGPNIAVNIVCTFSFDLDSANAASTLCGAFTSLILCVRCFTPFLPICPWSQLSYILYSSIVQHNNVHLFDSFWYGCSFWASFTWFFFNHVWIQLLIFVEMEGADSCKLLSTLDEFP